MVVMQSILDYLNRTSLYMPTHIAQSNKHAKKYRHEMKGKPSTIVLGCRDGGTGVK